VKTKLSNARRRIKVKSPDGQAFVLIERAQYEIWTDDDSHTIHRRLIGVVYETLDGQPAVKVGERNYVIPSCEDLSVVEIEVKGGNC
jgi:hypothetical protein